METEERIATEGTLECPVCFDVFRQGIYQCPDGHMMCQSCYASLSYPRSCPTCKIPYPPSSIRNRALELIACRAVALELVENPNPSDTPPPSADSGQGVKRPQKLTASPCKCDERKGVSDVRHEGVYCDGNQCVPTEAGDTRQPIEGTRYKCAECEDFDLCEACAMEGIHRHHLLIRVPDPDQSPLVHSALDSWREQLETATGPVAGSLASNGPDGSSSSSFTAESSYNDTNTMDVLPIVLSQT